MTQTDLVNAIGNVLTQIDTALMGLDPSMGQWQQLYALRKHLDDQQRSLVAATIQADDVAFTQAAAVVQLATRQLNAQIAAQNQIDSVIKTVSQISASLDQILKMV